MIGRYFKGSGSSLFIGIIIFLLTIHIYSEHIENQLLFVALYNYICCILGIALFATLVKFKLELKYILCSILYILLGLLTSIAYWPLFFIFAASSLVFYLVQLVGNKKLFWVLSLSGPLLLVIILFIY
ncbi:hypothetical protein CHH60_20525 [Paenibacillus sp. 7523-1]|nr:hypothetical protein CHH60_20525 [Paenibacillus sp. 7523-1]